MNLGILADIHEHNDHLRAAIVRLRELGVDRLIHLGDVCETGRHIEETVQLLRGAQVGGVFGNHELGLCVEPTDAIRERHAGPVFDYFQTLKPRLAIADCAFAHVEAWMDPADLEQPWYLHGRPNTPERIAQNLAATSQRVFFMGHYHCWLAGVERRVLPWDGRTPIILTPGRRFVIIVNAVQNGWCAWYNTESGELVPVSVKS